METMQDFEQEINNSFRKIKEGDIVKGTVIAISDEEVTLDLNYYAGGVIKVENLSNDPNYLVEENLKVGDEIEATVIRTDDGRGNIELSKKEANDVLAWDVLKQDMEENTIVTVTVKEAVKGGVVAFLEGIRGFIPASQLSVNYVEDLTAYVDHKLEVRVITVDEANKKLVMSAKSVALEKQTEERNHKISMLVPGSVVEGTVESVTTYGAFVSLGDGLTGLVHISQMSLKRIKSPHEVVKEGQKVKAKILNTNDGKISLSMKALEDAPDTKVDEEREAVEYTSKETASTSLGDLLKNLKL